MPRSDEAAAAGLDPTGSSSLVAQERVGMGPPAAPFWAASVALSAAALVALVVLTTHHDEEILAEAAQAAPAWEVLLNLPISLLRIAAAVASGAAVLATAHAVRNLTHSAVAGLVAAALVVLDPAFLVDGHLAIPQPFLLMAAVGALALAVSRHEWMHWLVPLPMALGTLLDPWFILWGGPILLLLLMRGHIYAAPKHLAIAAAQSLVVPAAITLPTHAIWPPPAACRPSMLDAMFLLTLPDRGAGHVAVHNPAIWVAGALTLVGLAVAGLSHFAGRFRIARLPGRFQVRLPGPVPHLLTRSMWLALFWVLAPTPMLWMPVLAAGLAMGARYLQREGLAFSLIVHAALLGFSLVYLIRFLPLLTGADGGLTVLQGAIPWADITPCPTGGTG